MHDTRSTVVAAAAATGPHHLDVAGFDTEVASHPCPQEETPRDEPCAIVVEPQPITTTSLVGR